MELTVTLCADHCAQPVAEVSAGEFSGLAEHLSAGTWQLDTTRGAVLATEDGRVLNDNDFSFIDSVLVHRRRAGTVNKEVVFSGDILGPGDDSGGRQSDKADRLTLRGHEAYGILSMRQAYPDPTQEPEGWARVRAAVNGFAANRAGDVVDLNMGGRAIESRRIPGLFVSFDSSGEQGSWVFDVRDSVADLVARICDEGGVTCNVLFDQSRGGHHVRFREPTDWSSEVTFADQGDLVELTQGVTAESTTVVIASRERSNDDLPPLDRDRWRLVEQATRPDIYTGWRRVERTVDSSPGEAVSEGRALMWQNRRKRWVTAIPIVDETHEWASKIMLGDLVGVWIEGEPLLLPVVQFDIQWGSSGSFVRPVLGAPSQRAARLMARRFRKLERRVTRIPRNLLEGGPVDDLAS